MTEPSQNRDFSSPVKVEAFSGLQTSIKMNEVPRWGTPFTQSMDYMDMKKQQSLLVHEPTEFEEGDDVTYLTGNYPFFEVMLAKTHVSSPYQLQLPAKIACMLPKARVPVVLRSGGKNWDMLYIGDCQRFSSRWCNFVGENKLEAGDACIFELKQNSGTMIKFRVIIIRNEMPHELQTIMSTVGTLDEPIEID